ncbi:MAG: AAA family ATPase [Prevotella sp.]|nr:AAA family ATPase [Prevotella sp.]
MLSDELKYQIHKQFPFAPTAEQEKALDVFSAYITDRNSKSAMILRGSAGTGKTTLAGAIVKTMVELKQKVILLAPTGRAAKVFSLNSSHDAFTIHRRIYRQKSFSGDIGVFNLNDNLYRDTLFIIDEASMISNQSISESAFGSGRLLDDLIQYVYSGQNCRMMLIGDNAQLPPIGEEESPALIPDILRGYSLNVYDVGLNEVLRQSQQSGILYNATVIRHMITHDRFTELPKIRFAGFADICMVPGDELIESLASSYSEVGIDETMVITRSNKRANIYNQGIRNTVMGREEPLTTGDILMIVKNNYYWAEREKSNITFIANGDRAEVQRIRNVRELYGFRFADVWLQFPDYNDYEMQTTVILDSLISESPSLTREQSEQLFNAVMEDYADIPLKHDRMKKIRTDIYYNALQIKYAYAVTCHKAQGGQWAHIYLDQGYMNDNMLTPDYIHWLYTAFTRATEKLFLVNWPKVQTENK